MSNVFILYFSSFQFDLVLKLFEEDDEAKGSTKKRTGATGRAGPSQKDNKKTVGLQVRAHKVNMTFGGEGLLMPSAV